jgi:DNA-binding response OmpR family regulator
VDDDLPTANALAVTLEQAGYETTLAHDGLSALDCVSNRKLDLIVLDWNLPQLDGLCVCRKIRAVSQVPIIMLTVRNSEDDVVAAFDAGVDDYVTKPFSYRQFVARVQALLRRTSTMFPQALTAGLLAFDPIRNEVRWGNKPAIRLTSLEASLLRVLILNADQVVTTDSLITYIWGTEGASRDTLKQLVYRLRNKIEPDPSSPTVIETVLNAGYILNTPYTETP